MELKFILILAFIIIVGSILRAFGKFVEAGGNVSKSMSELKKSDTTQSRDDSAHKKCTSQSYRTIAGILFGILLLYPVVVFSDKPIIEINPEWRLRIFGLLIFLEIVVLIIIWIKDRMAQKKS